MSFAIHLDLSQRLTLFRSLSVPSDWLVSSLVFLNPFPPRDHRRGRDTDRSLAGTQGGADPERDTAEPHCRVLGGSRRGIPDRLGEAGKRIWNKENSVRVCVGVCVSARQHLIAWFAKWCASLTWQFHLPFAQHGLHMCCLRSFCAELWE